MLSERHPVEAQLEEIIGAFPKVWNIRVKGIVKGDNFIDEVGDERISFDAEITIPLWCRLAARIQDIDYSAPIWLNLVALGVAVATF